MLSKLSVLVIVTTSLIISQVTYSDTRSVILDMEAACSGKQTDTETSLLKNLNVQCRPQVNHGGAPTPQALDKATLNPIEKSVLATITTYTEAMKAKDIETLANKLTTDFVIIQPGGNAWDKQTYMKGGVAHVAAMFSELSFDIEPIRISSTENSATVIATFRLGGLHMNKPATTFGLGTINLIKDKNRWLIQHIHNSGMQVY